MAKQLDVWLETAEVVLGCKHNKNQSIIGTLSRLNEIFKNGRYSGFGPFKRRARIRIFRIYIEKKIKLLIMGFIEK